MKPLSQKLISAKSKALLAEIYHLVDKARSRVAIYLNRETTLLYWTIGKHINENLKENEQATYGKQILATLSQELTAKYGKGFTYTALTRMCKVAAVFDEENIATLSQQLSWSHLIELCAIEDDVKRGFYMLLCIQNKWSVRSLRDEENKMLYERTSLTSKPKHEISSLLSNLNTAKEIHPDIVFKNAYVLDFLNLPAVHTENELENALVEKMEQFILELGNGFAFLERQKRISIDSEDYHLDLLFFHRKLRRLIAIDLKIGKFKPAYKGQMELYLRWLEKHEMQEGEEKPLGLLLCSEGNTEHIELLMLNEKEIKVAQYLTALPDKQWFAEKLHRARQIADEQNMLKNELENRI